MLYPALVRDYEQLQSLFATRLHELNKSPVFGLGHGRIGERIRMRQHVSYSLDTEHEGSVTVAVQCTRPACPNRSF